MSVLAAPGDGWAKPPEDAFVAAIVKGDYRNLLDLSTAAESGDLHAAYRRALALNLNGQYREAATLSLHALEAHPGPDEEKSHLYGQLAFASLKQGDYREAREYAERALNNGGAETAQQAWYASTQALSVMLGGDYRDAGRALGQASILAEKAKGGALSAWFQVLVKNNLAIGHYSLGAFQKAVASSREAMRVAERDLHGSHPELAESLNNMAAAQAALGAYDKAEQAYKRALRIREDRLGKRHPDFATSLNNLAVLLQQGNRLAEALPLLRKVLQARREVLGEQHPFTAASMDNLAQALSAAGRFGEALPLARRAANLSEARLGKAHPEVALAWRNLASLYESLGESARAEALFRQALNAQSAALGDHHPLSADTQQALAALLQRAGKFDEAESLLASALEARRRQLGAAHPRTAAALNDLGAIKLQLGKHGEAENLLRGALHVWSGGGEDHPAGAAALNNLARLMREQSRLEEAREFLDRAWRLIERFDSPVEQLKVLANLGMLARASERWEEAVAYYDQAIAKLEHVYAYTRALDDGERGAFIGKFAYVYLDYLDLLVNLHDEQAGAGYDRRALELLSLNQSRVFSELMARTGAGESTRDEGLRKALADERKAMARWDILRGELAQAVAMGGGARLRAEAASNAAWEAYRQAREAVAANYPRFQQMRAAKPLRYSDITARLQPGELALAYALLDEYLLIFAVRHDGHRLYRVPVKRQVLNNLVRHLRRSADIGHGLRGLRALNPKQLHLLFRYLLQPAVSELDAANKIFIMPDGALYTLPFAALVRSYDDDIKREFRAQRRAGESRGVYLTEYENLDYAGASWRLAYMPGFAALAALRERESSDAGFKRELVAFADPLFSQEDKAVVGGAADSPPIMRAMTRSIHGKDATGLRLAPLRNTADEARGIGALFGKASDLYLRDRAREANIARSLLHESRYVLFATHGLLGGDFNVAGAQPSLVLSLVNLAEGEDGFLTMSDVLDLKLRAQLVALSACNTAGEIDAALNGEGFAGLTRAFMYAGAENLLVTHWEVETHASEMMMKRGFVELKQGRDPLTATVVAQDALRAHRFDFEGVKVAAAHPFFWAPFVLVGAAGN